LFSNRFACYELLSSSYGSGAQQKLQRLADGYKR
jgi:hypothetical protein